MCVLCRVRTLPLHSSGFSALEIVATIGALVMIVAVVVAKLTTHGIVERMRGGIANVDSEKSRF